MTDNIYRTITLSRRAPVRIVETAWPIIARASGYAGSHACQANEEWSIRVRQHPDGRAIVYAVRDAGSGGMPASYHGTRTGELLGAGADLAAAIQRVGEEGGIPEHTIAECIADLPAELI